MGSGGARGPGGARGFVRDSFLFFPAGEHVVGISGEAAGGAGSWVSPERFSA